MTLGIPRLREIIMTASDKLKTPIMEVPLVPGLTKVDAERIASTLNRLNLTSYLTNATCKESMLVHSHGNSTRLYTIRLNILPMAHESVRSNNLAFADFVHCFERSFCIQLNAAVMKQVKLLAKGHAGTPVIVSKGGRAGTDREEEGALGGAGRSELDAVSERLKSKHKEMVGYDAPDAEDLAAMAAGAPGDDKEGSDSEDEIDQSGEKATKHRAKDAAKAKARAQAAADAQADDAAAHSALTDLSVPGDAAFNVLQKCSFLHNVSYDPAHQWLEVVVQVSLSIPKLLMMSMVENLLPSVLLRATPKIAKSFVVEKFKANSSSQEKEVLVQTDGVNFHELYKYQELFDCNRISSNDIAAILRTYGVEAARASIVREVTAVFKVYGISIDPRHLGLVADYMVRRSSTHSATAQRTRRLEQQPHAPTIITRYACSHSLSRFVLFSLCADLPRWFPSSEPCGHRFQPVSLPEDQLRDQHRLPHQCMPVWRQGLHELTELQNRHGKARRLRYGKLRSAQPAALLKGPARRSTLVSLSLALATHSRMYIASLSIHDNLTSFKNES